MTTSPYDGQPETEWSAITRTLIGRHPLRTDIAAITLDTWESIFSSQLGRHGFRIGRDIAPKPQIMAFLLHELIGLEVAARYPGLWRGEDGADEKDLVCLEQPEFSIEIKASSNPTSIFGNRSYAQVPGKHAKGKLKSGYYLAVNFPKVEKAQTQMPHLKKIAFGWIDHTDWIAQTSETGQRARLHPRVYQYKLVTLFPE